MSDKQKVFITDTTLRDAHQSLFATRMRIEDMIPIAEKIDQVGYWSVEVWGGATFDSCIRFLGEDPWERITELKKYIKKTPFQMLLRGQNLVGYRHYADDVVNAFVDKAAERGIDVFRIFDALNDVRNLETAIKAVKKAGKHAEGAISFTTSPVHTMEKFVQFAKDMESLGCDTICIKDMAGIMLPQSVRNLVKALKKEIKVPIHLHTHMTSGLGMLAYQAGVEEGASIVDCAISSLSMGTSQPPIEAFVYGYEGTPYEMKYDKKLLLEIADYFKGVRENDFMQQFCGASMGVDPRVLTYQVPGGMISNQVNQLKEAGKLDKLQEVFDETPKVRKDLGYIPLVTPTSQIVGVQAAFNVIMGERYKMITKETKDVLKGMYGKTPAPVDEEIRKKALGDEKPVTCRPADLIKPEMDKLRKEVVGKGGKDTTEDTLTYALFPQVAPKFFKMRESGEKPEIIKPKETPKAAEKETAQDTGPKNYTVVVDGKTYNVSIAEGSDIPIIQEKKAAAPQTAPASPAAPTPPPVAPTPQASGGKPVNSDLPGDILKINVKPGDVVKKDDTVLIMESMKMENPIQAQQGGKIVAINVTVGQKVAPGDTLYTIE